LADQGNPKLKAMLASQTGQKENGALHLCVLFTSCCYKYCAAWLVSATLSLPKCPAEPLQLSYLLLFYDFSPNILHVPRNGAEQFQSFV